MPIAGKPARAHLPVATLGYSRRTYVKVFVHQRQSAWFAGIEGQPSANRPGPEPWTVENEGTSRRVRDVESPNGPCDRCPGRAGPPQRYARTGGFAGFAASGPRSARQPFVPPDGDPAVPHVQAAGLSKAYGSNEDVRDDNSYDSPA